MVTMEFFEPEFVTMYEFDLVAKKFVRIAKKGGKLFEARWLQSNFCTFVPSNFLQSAFLTITLSTVYEACGNVQLISRKTEQSNSGGATEKKQG